MIQVQKLIIDEASPHKRGEVLFESNTPGSYEYTILKGGVFEVYCIGSGGKAVATPVYDDIGYLATGGSGGGFIGKFRLGAGKRSITIGALEGLGGSSVSGIVSVGGGGNGVARLTPGAAGAAPTLSMTPLSTTLNTAGNQGKSGTGGKGGSIAPVKLSGGASVYQEYGQGGDGQASEYWQQCYTNPPKAGYVKIVYLGRR